MNKAFHIIWSHAHQALVVTSELSSARSKRSGTRLLLAAASASLLAAVPGMAQAANVCASGLSMISSPVDSSVDDCRVGSGANVIITADGSFDTGATAITAANSFDSIQNSGRLRAGEAGIELQASPGNAKTANDIRNEVGSYIESGNAAGFDIGNNWTVGNLFNGGEIHSVQSSAIRLDGATVTGSIHNGTGAVLDGMDGAIMIRGGSSVGAILNDGLIGGDWRGIAIDSSHVDSIGNNGTVRGGVEISNGASVGTIINLNRGSIENGTSGISVLFSSTVHLIHNGGTIDGLNQGIGIYHDSHVDTITNDGTINGGAQGIAINNSTVDTIGNGGGAAISGSRGIELSGGAHVGMIFNNGAINGNSGIDLDNASVGAIINDSMGTIGTGNLGIDLENASSVGSISNSGAITGNEHGIYIGNSTVTTIDNNATGAITGRGDSGIWLSNGSRVDVINNSGRIEGGTYAISVDDGATLSNLNLSGTRARLIGDVYAPNTDVTVKSGAVFGNDNAFEVRSFTVENGAVFNFGRGPHMRWGVDADGITVSQGFRNNGTVAVAAGVTAAIHGDYAQDSGAALKVGVLNDNTYGKLIVDGTATLPSNAKIVVDVTTPGFKFSTDRLQGVLSAGTLVSDGTFSVSGNSLLFTFDGVKHGNAVDLVLSGSKSASVLDSVRSTGNTPAHGAAATLDQIIANNPNGELAGHFVGLSTRQQVSNAVSSTQPTAAGSAGTATNSVLSGINRVIQARQENNRGLSSGSATADSNLWMKAFGAWANQGQRSGISGYDADTNGFAIGADTAVNNQSRLGLAFAYAKTKVDNTSSIAPQNVQIDTFQLIGYGSHALTSDTELNVQLDFGQNRNQSKRYMPFANANAKATYDGYNAHLGLGIGHSMQLSERLTFIPSARTDYTWIGTQSYRETGAGALNLKVASNDAEQLLVSFDGKFNYKWNDTTVVSANLGAGYDLIGGRTSLTSAYAGEPGAVFKTPGMEMERWVVRSGLGLAHSLASGTEISLRYDVETRSGFLSQGASVKARWVF